MGRCLISQEICSVFPLFPLIPLLRRRNGMEKEAAPMCAGSGGCRLHGSRADALAPLAPISQEICSVVPLFPLIPLLRRRNGLEKEAAPMCGLSEDAALMLMRRCACAGAVSPIPPERRRWHRQAGNIALAPRVRLLQWLGWTASRSIPAARQPRRARMGG